MVINLEACAIILISHVKSLSPLEGLEVLALALLYLALAEYSIESMSLDCARSFKKETNIAFGKWAKYTRTNEVYMSRLIKCDDLLGF